MKAKANTNNFEDEKTVFTKLEIIPEAYIVKINVEKTVIIGDHYEFILKVFGRSRFCNYLPTIENYLSYTVRTRYSKLKTQHDILKNNLLKFTKSSKAMPQFPNDSWLESKEIVAKRRITQFNQYFDEIFHNFGNLAMFDESLINFYEPFPVDILILSSTENHCDKYLNSVIRHLYKNTDALKSLTPDTKLYPILHERLCNKKPIVTYTTEKKDDVNLWKRNVPFDYVSNE